MGAIRIGTSGWHYSSWRGPFFPACLMAKHRLRYYSTQFDSVELNGVFYRTPTRKTLQAWASQTPKDFVFAWKASQFITHWKRLGSGSRKSLALMETRLRLLKRKAGPVLFQLPPSMKIDCGRLDAFFRLLRKRRRYAVEFRHPSWYCREVFALLRAHDVALCISDHHDAPSPWIVTARHVYVRCHGPGGRYSGHYAKRELKMIADRIRRWRRRGHDVYVYFDNDQKSAAPADAAGLRELIGV